MTASPVAAPTPVPAAQRGATVIADRALGRIAVQAANDAIAASAARSGTRRRIEGTGAQGRATVRRARARVALRVSLPYPADIGALCGAVQRHVSARTAELAGLPVTAVRVRVDRLVPAGTARRRVA